MDRLICCHITIVCVLLQCHIAVATNVPREPDEQRLYNQLMDSYLSTVKPALNDSKPLQIIFSMRLNQIVNLNERQQVLTTNAFIDQAWTDPALAWDPREFRDVRSLRVPADQIWRPDTFIYNNVNNGSTGFIHGTYIQIRHTGEVTWPVPVRLRSSCVVKIAYFPFDYQVCMVRFGSWIYSYSLVDYIVRDDVVSVDLSTYIKNSEWELVSMRLEKSITNRSRGRGLHPSLTAMLYLKRNTFYYLFNIIVPCVMLSMLTLMTFWLPPTSGEKVTLGLSVFLAFSMFMLLIAEEVPASSDAVPVIGIYLCVVMTMTSLSVICAVIVTNLHSRGSKLRPAPRWLASLFIRYLAVPFCVSQDVHLLARTIHLSDYCQFFILHNNQCERMEAFNKDNQISNNDKEKTAEVIQTTAAESEYTRLYQSEHMQTATKYTQSQLTNKPSVCHRQHHRFHHCSQDTGQETTAEDELEFKKTNEMKHSTFLRAHTPFISVCEHDAGFQSSGCPDIYEQQETVLDAASTRVTQDNKLPTSSRSELPAAGFSSDSNKDTFDDHYYITACNKHEKFCECDDNEGDIWLRREDAASETIRPRCGNYHDSDSDTEVKQMLISGLQQRNISSSTTPSSNFQQRRRQFKQRRKRQPSLHGNTKLVLKRAKIMIAEWCTIAKVVDRILFTFSLLATVTAYILILIVVPAGNKTMLENATLINSVRYLHSM